jgi:signal transduction histidine kinase
MGWGQAAGFFRWRGGIRQRLLWTGLVFLGAALLVNTIAGSLYTRRQIQGAAVQLQTEVASRAAHQVARVMNRKIERLKDLAASLSLSERSVEQQTKLALLLVKADSVLTGVTVLDATGRELFDISDRRVSASVLRNRSGEIYFRTAMKGEAYISPVYRAAKGEPYVRLAVPILSDSGDPRGVIAAESNLTVLWQIITDLKFSENGNIYLVDGDGNVIAQRGVPLMLNGVSLRDHFKVRQFLGRPREPDSKAGEEGTDQMGRRVLATYASVDGLGWAVVLTAPVDVALADLGVMLRYAILLLFVGVGVGSLLIIWVSRKITAPIRELHRGVEIIRHGNLEHRVDIKTGDEIETLATEFNAMAEELENSYGTLEQRVERRTRDLAALYDVTKTVNQSLDLESVLEEVIQKVTDIFHFNSTRIYLTDFRTGDLRLQASYATHPNGDAKVRFFRRGEGIIGHVAETGEPMIFEDLRNDPRYQKLSSSKNTRQTGNAFLAIFPITAKFKTVGAILCNGHKPRRLTAGEIQLISSMAGQIGVAVENARLYSETKHKSTELESANRDMLAAYRAKGDFLAAMSHELRTPLNVIIGNADLCKDGFFGDLSAKQREALEKVLRYSRILLKLINDVLTLTRIEAKKMSLDLSTFDVRDVIEQVQDYVEQLNQKHRVDISWAVPAKLPPLTTDALKLEEILQNLIGNAYKFTPTGSIEIRARDLPLERRVEFAVADSGIGISQENLEKIFDEFHQLKDAHTGNYSGVGLGLSIVKKYLELMLGEIRVESTPGIGSTFTFTLPYSLLEAVAALPHAEA